MSRSLLPLASVGAILVLLAACGSTPPSASSPTPTVSSPAPSPSSPAPSAPSAESTPNSPSPSPTATTSATPSPVQSTTGGAGPSPRFTLTSAAFRAGGRIPAGYTCDGRDVSPALGWTGAPVGTASLALVVDDPDAGHFAHWTAYAIAPGTTRLAEGAGAAGARLAQGTNDFGSVGYGGPCPPSGTHHYVFTLYALAAPLDLSGAPGASAVRAALARARVLGKATLTATYHR